MRIFERIEDVRAALDKERASGRRVGFVPTMGALHDGHVSLIRAARQDSDVTAVSIFVNPLQFGASEDLGAYPRNFERDARLCEAAGVDALFHPPVEEMYPERSAVRVAAGPVGEGLEGASRPGHFDGVATVVAKLFNIIGPCTAYFGQKDAQQLAVIRSVVRALDIPVNIIGCPTVREPDGLAMSSRNVYLTPAERAAATVLKRALDDGVARIATGERDGGRVAAAMAATISSEPLARLDYTACVDPDTFQPLVHIRGQALLAIAAWLGRARLIDNTTTTVPGERPDAAAITEVDQ